MSDLSIWNWLVIVMALTVVANGFIAQRKNRSVAGCITLGLLFNPVALIVLLSLPSVKPDGSPRSMEELF